MVAGVPEPCKNEQRRKKQRRDASVLPQTGSGWVGGGMGITVGEMEFLEWAGGKAMMDASGQKGDVKHAWGAWGAGGDWAGGRKGRKGRKGSQMASRVAD